MFKSNPSTSVHNESDKTFKRQNNNDNNINMDNKSLRFYAGLTLAGIASTFLTSLFGLLHLQVFLQSYHLPLPVYSVGSTIFAIINTANDVAGAWLVDSCTAMTGRQRHELIGLSGCLFALCFLTPFFRWTGTNTTHSFWSGLHFVVSLSLYDTLWSFDCILVSSILTDHSRMTDQDRVRFLAVGKVCNMLFPMLVAKWALNAFDVHNLQPLRQYLVGVAMLVCGMSLIAQKLLLAPSTDWDLCTLVGCNKKAWSKSKVDNDNNDTEWMLPSNKNKIDSLHETSGKKRETTTPKKPLEFRKVVQDFISHDNFRYWIGMEMLLEGQTTFMRSFLKTFVDHLILANDDINNAGNSKRGLSRATCDWFLSSTHALISITNLLFYIPIRRYGYGKMYSCVFGTNMIMASSLLMLVAMTRRGNHGFLSLDNATYDNNTPHTPGNVDDEEQWDYTMPLFAFLMVYTVLTAAIGSAGFGLAMADMVLELKATHAWQGRWDEPSLAGLFMGVNALFCKPAESILPIVTATLLGSTNDFYSKHDNIQPLQTDSSSTQTVLLRLLILPPLVCSILQLWVWSHYDLHPQKTQVLRKQWETLLASKGDENLEMAECQDHSKETITTKLLDD